ncbi:MAG TPA: thioredoxin domain-containing protein [Acidimicrobiales bacterium]|nr:thioredoxin domain-containing protein [Acidimicrobiales bacterium]
MPGRNRLAAEASPYLRQHADNPVDWHPWGDEAFAEARERDVPVLVSVGYSACHWCHVMAHESFEDPDVAAVMNRVFVNVKVDREERPDVDDIYMEATQAMTGQGGWPMTVVCTPDGRPFFAGTYFPKERRGGMIGFVELCERIEELWHTQRGDLLQQADQLTSALGRSALITGGQDLPTMDELDGAVRSLVAGSDREHGGLGGAPKFPQPMAQEALAAAAARGDLHARDALTTTLDGMASGGIYDHLGGGFARYAVDAIWLVPHFEKMLYDNALLIRLYLHGWQVTALPRYRQVLAETIGYVLRDLRQPGGGVSSAEDADSEGEEGRFYVWTEEEVREVLADEKTADAAALALEWYGFRAGGNFEHGTTIPNRLHARGDLDRPPAVETARRRLFERRATRVRPGLDDKVLTEWNAYLVAALAEAGAAAEEPAWVEAAVGIAEFLLANLRRDDGRWLRSWQADVGARHLAYATDHGALVDAFTRLGEATGEARWISEARTAADALLDLFWDEERGGVFTSGHDAEALIARPKDLMDNATPGANGLAAVGLLRLAALTGDDRYRDRGLDVVRLLGPLAVQHPTAFGHVLAAVDLAVRGTTEIVVAGDRPDLLAAARRPFLPNAVLAWGERWDSPLWEGREDGRAYVCQSYTCKLPAESVEALTAQLSP